MNSRLNWLVEITQLPSWLCVTVTQAWVTYHQLDTLYLRLYFQIYCMCLATHWCMISSSCLYSWIGSVHILRTLLWLLWLIYGNSRSHLGSSVCVECLLPWRHRDSLLSIFVDVLIKLTFSNKRRRAAARVYGCCLAGARKEGKDSNVVMKAELQYQRGKQRETATFLKSIFYLLQNIHCDYMKYLKSISFKLCKNVSQDGRARTYLEINQQNIANEWFGPPDGPWLTSNCIWANITWRS